MIGTGRLRRSTAHCLFAILVGYSVAAWTVQDLEIPENLLEGAQQFLRLVESGQFSASNCQASLEAIYTRLFNTPPEYFIRDEVQNDIRPVLETIWRARLGLRKKLRDFYTQNKLDYDCANTIRTALRTARFIEEYLLDNFVDEEHQSMFAGGFPHTVVNPDFSQGFDWHNDLRSGDILLSRGNAYSSAAIARLAETDSQFSHLTLVYRDSRHFETLESWIETGTLVRDIQAGYLQDGHARVAVYRHAGPETVPHQAARTMRGILRDHEKARGVSFPYDFGMNLDTPDDYFCAEVIARGYSIATSGELVLPLFPSRFPGSTADFRALIGISRSTGFTPSDIEIDPRFELIAEWRDVGKIHDARLKDALLTMMFNWMEDPVLNYRFFPTITDRVKARASVTLRHIPVASGLTGMDKRLSASMRNEAVAQFLTLDRTAEPLHLELKRIDDTHRRETGFSMVAKELYIILEELRQSDLRRYQGTVPGKVIFHQTFHPKALDSNP